MAFTLQDLYQGRTTFTASQIADNDVLPMYDLTGDGGDPVSYHPITTWANAREKILTGIPFLRLASSAYVVVTTSTVLTDAHNGKIIVVDAESNIDITYNSGLTLPFQCSFLQANTGKFIFVAGGGTGKVCADNAAFDRSLDYGAAVTLTAIPLLSAVFFLHGQLTAAEG